MIIVKNSNFKSPFAFKLNKFCVQNISRPVIAANHANLLILHLDGKYVVLPSGELQIRNVSAEDGFKTYKCRTKHRLTGIYFVIANTYEMPNPSPFFSSSFVQNSSPHLFLSDCYEKKCAIDLFLTSN